MKYNFNLKREYKKSWNYIKESKNFIYLIIGIFIVFILVGFFIPTPQSVVEQILKFIKELLEKTQNMSQGELIRFILLNNSQTSLFGIIFGVLLGIFPIIATIINGYLLGFVASISVEREGFIILWKLLPHGIFELPAIFISFGLGLKFGTFIFRKNKSKSFREYLINSLRVFLFIILPLLIIAAIIEGTLIFIYK
ncbi:hypothetical protein CMI40_01100 [Candidatus Pacearchaeota archaeon]|jgi:stage II sporulation protein M|nr:hypothetical protein [Candidatus Pacearchaeota archaeon]|tara:strand:- start:7691 stop:8278 length:588 start_codon:yes stop_codon:yes gene_type:complete